MTINYTYSDKYKFYNLILQGQLIPFMVKIVKKSKLEITNRRSVKITIFATYFFD